MTNLILQPAGNADSREHYQDTVKSLVRIKDIELQVNYWGSPTWTFFFFSRSADFCGATTTFKSQNERLARHHGMSAKGDTWECMYFMSGRA